VLRRQKLRAHVVVKFGVAIRLFRGRAASSPVPGQTGALVRLMEVEPAGKRRSQATLPMERNNNREQSESKSSYFASDCIGGVGDQSSTSFYVARRLRGKELVRSTMKNPVRYFLPNGGGGEGEPAHGNRVGALRHIPGRR